MNIVSLSIIAQTLRMYSKSSYHCAVLVKLLVTLFNCATAETCRTVAVRIYSRVVPTILGFQVLIKEHVITLIVIANCCYSALCRHWCGSFNRTCRRVTVMTICGFRTAISTKVKYEVCRPVSLLAITGSEP